MRHSLGRFAKTIFLILEVPAKVAQEFLAIERDTR